MENKTQILRINEAIARANRMGKKVIKREIAAKIWGTAVPKKSLSINMANLSNGRTKNISPEAVLIICQECDCTPNYLFGYEE